MSDWLIVGGALFLLWAWWVTNRVRLCFRATEALLNLNTRTIADPLWPLKLAEEAATDPELAEDLRALREEARRILDDKKATP